ncbi:hypothetical protein C8R45DRAFT_1091639 [Mycena sanguinolenta]|nr:hypothetical protein C8R45DRAFT_1091639 [Mycena sanguinolenta]
MIQGLNESQSGGQSDKPASRGNFASYFSIRRTAVVGGQVWDDNATVPLTEWSADLDTKLSIIRVCKKWHRIGLELLYESVVLHWIGQLPAFVYALEALADGIGAFVQHLRIEYWVPRGYHTLHNTELKKIFKLCPRLMHFAFNPQLLPIGPIPAFPEVSTLGAIAHLEICDRVKYAAVVPALVHLCSTLRSLSLLLPTTYAADHPTLNFACLENLRLGVAGESVLPGPGAIWAIPQLQQLLIHCAPTCEIAGTMSPSSERYFTVVRAFLDAYGRTLRVLSVRNSSRGANEEPEPDFEQFLEPCPVLQHLYVTDRSRFSGSWFCGIFRSVDILNEIDPFWVSRFADLKAELEEGYPQLRTCRRADVCLDLFPELPPTGEDSNDTDDSELECGPCDTESDHGPDQGSDQNCDKNDGEGCDKNCDESCEDCVEDSDENCGKGKDHDEGSNKISSDKGCDEDSDEDFSEGSDEDQGFSDSDEDSDDNNFEHIDDSLPSPGDDEEWEIDRAETMIIFRHVSTITLPPTQRDMHEEKTYSLQYSLAHRLPDETLLAIFRLALPSSWVAKNWTTLPPFPRTGWSADLNTKLSIIQVCKRWHRIGLEFLYEMVTLHSIGQLPVFAEALETIADGGMGVFVQHLRIEYWVPRGYHTLHNTELKKIFELCPRLKHFAFNPQPLPLLPIPAFPEVSTLGAIAHLEICDRVKYAAVVPALVHLCPTLRSLSLLLPTTYDAHHPTLVFASLENLRLGVAAESVFPGPGPIWVIPDLKQLLIHCTPKCELAGTRPPLPDVYLMVVRLFLMAYGRALSVLSVRIGAKSSSQETRQFDFDQLLTWCPVLQHLYVTAQSRVSRPSMRSGMLVSWDIMDETDISVAQYAGQRANLKDSNPTLRTYRFTDSCLDLFPELPAIGADSNGLSSFSTASYLQFLCSEAYDGEDDTRQNFNGDLSDQDSDYNDFDNIDDTVPTADDDVDWEVDREEAMAIFRGTLIQ